MGNHASVRVHRKVLSCSISFQGFYPVLAAISKRDPENSPEHSEFLCVCSSNSALSPIHDVCRNADSTLPMAERRNYKGVGDAFVRIVGEDGVGGLFRGAGPTIVRAMALNMGMFASNEQAKEMLTQHTSLTGLPMCGHPLCV